MLKRIVLAFAVVALAVASAGTVAKSNSYKVTLLQPSVVKGTELQAGEYRLDIADSKITLSQGKQTVELPAKVENVDKKFDNTAVRYVDQNGKPVISEIRLGGTKTKVVFNQ